MREVQNILPLNADRIEQWETVLFALQAVPFSQCWVVKPSLLCLFLRVPFPGLPLLCL